MHSETQPCRQVHETRVPLDDLQGKVLSPLETLELLPISYWEALPAVLPPPSTSRGMFVSPSQYGRDHHPNLKCAGAASR